MKYANIHQAKTNLSQYLELASQGEEIIICRAGRPIAKLVNYQSLRKIRVPGEWKGKIQISDNFDEVDENINKLFYKL